MTPAKTPQGPPHDFYPAFAHLPKAGQAVICGGQAVNLLAAVFLTEPQIKAILGPHGSATSSDMDIVICKELQQQIVETSNKSKGFTLKSFSDCRQPIRFAILPDDMPDTRIDVLREIKGIHLEKDRVFEDSIDIDAPYKVINPTTAMIAKAENCATLEQNTPTETRNDFNHLRLLIPIVHNFLKELVDNCDPESKDGQREIIGFLKKIKKASQTPNFIRGMQKAGVSLRDAIPTQHILNSSLEVLKNYLDHTFLGNHPKSPKKSEPEIQ